MPSFQEIIETIEWNLKYYTLNGNIKMIQNWLLMDKTQIFNQYLYANLYETF